MKKHLLQLSVFLILLLILPYPGLGQVVNILYVDGSKASSGNDLSWKTAHKTLQEALSAASSNTEIWVAEGTYKPGAARSDTFQLKSSVAIYGGFSETINYKSNPVQLFKVFTIYEEAES